MLQLTDPITVRLPKGTKGKLKQKSERTGIPESTLVREAVMEKYPAGDGDPSVPEDYRNPAIAATEMQNDGD